MFKTDYEWCSKIHYSPKEQNLKLVAVGRMSFHKECLKYHFINIILMLYLFLFKAYEILGIYQFYYL